MKKKSISRVGRTVLREAIIVGLAALTVQLGVTLFQTMMAPKPPVVAGGTDLSGRPGVTVGRQLSIHGVELKNAAWPLIVYTSPQCPYCLLSKGFHGSLVAEARKQNVPVVIAVPSIRTAQAYLDSAHLSGAIIKTWSDVNLAFHGTPTLALVDVTGTIKRIWEGEAS
jgi:hypothetical protein